MLAALADAIAQLDIPVDSLALRTAIALHDRLGAKVTAAVGEFDEHQLWDVDAAPSMKMWLIDEGLASQDADRLVRYGKRIRQLDIVRRLWEVGDLSNGQVRAICENVIDRHVRMFQDIEAELATALVGLSVKETSAVLAEWRARADAIDDETPSEPERSLYFSPTLDGRYVTNGAFDPAGGDVIAAALAVADSNDLDTAASRRRADALVQISQFFLDHHRETLTPRQRPHVSLMINADDLAGFAGGHGHAVNPATGGHYDAATVARYLCDCAVSRTVAERVGGAVSRVLDLGRAQRTASAAQRNALAVRDRGCRWKGCGAPAGWCEAHHIHPWELGGSTDMDNLVLLCGRHHDLVHRKGIQLKLLPDATFVATDRNGVTRTSRPPGAHEPPPFLL